MVNRNGRCGDILSWMSGAWRARAGRVGGRASSLTRPLLSQHDSAILLWSCFRYGNSRDGANRSSNKTPLRLTLWPAETYERTSSGNRGGLRLQRIESAQFSQFSKFSTFLDFMPFLS